MMPFTHTLDTTRFKKPPSRVQLLFELSSLLKVLYQTTERCRHDFKFVVRGDSVPVPKAVNVFPSVSDKITTFSFTAGLYFYIEASGRAMGDVARLVTPRIQSNGNATCMVFYYHLYGHSIGNLRVKVEDQVLWQLSGNQGNSWYKATVPLNFHGTYTVR